ncbi:MAG: peptidylprolyl isomerase [Solobacterium sp.]|nr:peptidylprolyl isomerase [Solobacterium sp.]
MKRLIQIFVSAAAVLSLTACTAGREAVDVSDLEGVPAEAGKDITAYLTGNTLKSDAVLAQADGVKLYADELSFEMTNQYNSAYRYYMSYLGFEPDLSEEIEPGVTLGDMLASHAAEGALNAFAAEAVAKKNGVVLSEETAKDVSSAADNFSQQLGNRLWSDLVTLGKINEADFDEEQKKTWITENGQRTFRNYMLYYGTTKEGFREYYEKDAWYGEAVRTLFQEGGKYAPTDESLNKMAEDYIDQNGTVWARCILFSAMNITSDEEAEKVREKAEQAYASLSALSGQELKDAFTQCQSENDESGYTPGEIQMYTADSALVDGYYDGIFKLKPGEIGMTDKTDYGWFILLREDNDTAALKQQLAGTYPQTKMDELIQEYLESKNIKPESLYEKIDLTSYFGKVREIQEVIAAAQEAELSAE